jgi:transcriptional regulator with XRE-family HTH domain
MLKELREYYGLSQDDLADITGIAQSNIAAIESSRRKLTDKMFERIKNDVSEWYKNHNSAVDRAVYAAFNKPHLKRMRNEE